MPPSNYLLLTDSLSSLLTLQNLFSTNPLTQRIQLALLSLYSIGSHITLAWIPGHVDFPDHDVVDEAAKLATSIPKISDPILSPASDLKSYYRSLIFNLWYKDWDQQTNNKLRKIKNKPTFWSSSLCPVRRDEVVLSRLRIGHGHTRLTHSFLLLGLLSRLSCPYCLEENLSVDQFFTCPDLQSLRSSLSVPSSIVSALSNNSQSTSNSLSYLKSTRFFSLL